MSRIAFITRQAPHGKAIAREALDAILATSALTEALSVFFIGDGVYQLLKHQATDNILSRNFSSTFKLFDLYDIDNVYVCRDSLIDRGIDSSKLLISVASLPQAEINEKIRHHQTILNF